jgi:hypothetical protein
VKECLDNSTGVRDLIMDQNWNTVYKFIADIMKSVDEGVAEGPPAQQPLQADG